jgi:predicted DNA-binding protein (MmcQ/YjbR family)
MTDRFRARVAALAAALPGATCDDPWGGGHEAWKVGGKMFACFGAVTPGVSVKTPDIDTAQMLIEAGAALRAPYFHRSWVLLPETADDDALRHRILTSYRLVRAGLPAALRRSLPEPDEA